MVDAALTQHRTDVAIKLVDVADRPGRHQQWLRRRRAELAATQWPTHVWPTQLSSRCRRPGCPGGTVQTNVS
jgi:hypothetical protein